MSSDCSDLARPSGDILPTLVEVTFRPQSEHCCSFTAVIREGCDGRGVSFGQMTKLIENIGHAGKIDDLTIKPREQHSFLLTGFSRQISPQPSSSRTTVATAAKAGRDCVDATRTRRQHGTAMDIKTFAPRRTRPSSSDDDGGLSESNSEPNSNSDECLSEDEQACPSTANTADGQP